MANKQQKATAEWILDQIGTVNPYNRVHENRKSEYYIYQGGFLAGYLASLMQEDPWMLKRFQRHIEDQKTLDNRDR